MCSNVLQNWINECIKQAFLNKGRSRLSSKYSPLILPTDYVNDEVAFNISSEDTFNTFDRYNDYQFHTLTRFFETDPDSQLEIVINLNITYNDSDDFELSVGEGNSLRQNTLVTLTRYYFGEKDQMVKVFSNQSSLWLQMSLNYLPKVEEFKNTLIAVNVRKVNSLLQGKFKHRVENRDGA